MARSNAATSPVPRPEYPRPQFRRPDWINLNGEWAFAFDDEDVGLRRGWWSTPAEGLRSGGPFERRITVPFCYQAPLSGIGETSFHDVVWYARLFEPPPIGDDGRLLLHFGAVDYRTGDFAASRLSRVGEERRVRGHVRYPLLTSKEVRDLA